MGESWGDLVAAEYMFSHGYSNAAPARGRSAPTPPATRSPASATTPIDKNPLNYGPTTASTRTGDEVHADGEIWNGTQWEVRQALVEKWTPRSRTRDKALQLAAPRLTAARPAAARRRCPGNRRWVQLMFDAFLLQQGATSMLDARDAMLAADQMRFDGANQKALWQAFARRGMGKRRQHPERRLRRPDARASPRRGHRTPGDVRRQRPGTVYVGRYEARATPVADTIAGTELEAQVAVHAGQLPDALRLARAAASQRFTLKVPAKARASTQTSADQEVEEPRGGRRRAPRSSAPAPARCNTELADRRHRGHQLGRRQRPATSTSTHPYVVVDLAGGAQTVTPRSRSARC